MKRNVDLRTWDPNLTLFLTGVVYRDLRTNQVSSHRQIREENDRMATLFYESAFQRVSEGVKEFDIFSLASNRHTEGSGQGCLGESRRVVERLKILGLEAIEVVEYDLQLSRGLGGYLADRRLILLRGHLL
jgi:hypothetical protein